MGFLAWDMLAERIQSMERAIVNLPCGLLGGIHGRIVPMRSGRMAVGRGAL